MSNEDPLHTGNFKNIGIDPDFIKSNANLRNNQMNEHYHGGQRQVADQGFPGQAPQQQPQASQPPAQPQPSEPVAQVQTQANIDIVALKKEMEAMMDKKVYDLAVKMQQFADQTDTTLEKIQNKLREIERAGPSQSGQQTLAQQKPASAPAQQAPTPQPQNNQQQTAQSSPEKNGYSEADVAIDKIFDFSNKAGGRR